MTYDLPERDLEIKKIVNHFYSVELAYEGLDYIYQYKIWHTDSEIMCILVKEKSCILPYLKENDILNLKYYPINIRLPFEIIDTQLVYVRFQLQGRSGFHLQSRH